MDEVDDRFGIIDRAYPGVCDCRRDFVGTLLPLEHGD